MRDKTKFLEPYAPKDPLMYGAWVGSLRYALTRDDVLEAFEKETGKSYRVPRNEMERLVDEASGYAADFFVAFAKWHNENIWGVEEDGSPVDRKEQRQ